MNLSSFSDSQLLAETKIKVKKEKEATLDVLPYLREIDNRKLYLEMRYSSLHTFCASELGYSGTAAGRRIASMRLLRELPEVLDKLKEDKVNLSTLTQLQVHIRREEKLDHAKLPKEEKLSLLNQIEGKSEDSSKRELLKNTKYPEVVRENQRIVTEDFTEIKFGADNETMEKFKQLKDLLAHKNPNPSWQEFFKTWQIWPLKRSIPLRKRKNRPGCPVR